jgi:hypothetical protein
VRLDADPAHRPAVALIGQDHAGRAMTPLLGPLAQRQNDRQQALALGG